MLVRRTKTPPSAWKEARAPLGGKVVSLSCRVLLGFSTCRAHEDARWLLWHQRAGPSATLDKEAYWIVGVTLPAPQRKCQQILGLGAQPGTLVFKRVLTWALTNAYS